MTSKSDTKNAFLNNVNERSDELERISKDILSHPESGYKEQRTSRLVAEWFATAGFEVQTGVGITGVAATLDTGKPGPHIAVMGELDSLIVPGHSFADDDTGAAHACGHHAQIGSMLGVAAGLVQDQIKNTLTGRVSFFATPAEEYIELGFRERLREEGQIEFFGGKQEFIKLGFFNDVDVAMLTHTGGETAGTIGVGGSNNGMIGKTVTYIGRAAHAGGSPHLGINALNAAHLGLAGIHAQRETFRDSDTVRVHPVITKGGDAVNSVPANVQLETYVRASNVPAILNASEKVDRALKAGALATGATVEISTSPGYLPAKYDKQLTEIYRNNAASLIGDDNVIELPHSTGCTDMGDVSQIVATIQPTANATSGTGHGIDYFVENYDLAVIKSAKAMGLTVIDLLSDNAQLAKKVSGSFKAPMSISEYLSRMRGFRSVTTFSE